ncbi:MAG: hypothetical protein ACFFF4_10245 [Candidatus Thorarchaeota archaeon]
MQFTDPFNMFDDFFNMFGTFFLISVVFTLVVFVIIVVAIVKVCRSANTFSSGITIEPPPFVIPERHQGQRRADGTEIKTVRLPTKCPSCGAAISQEGIDWVGPLEAKCNYCGGTVRASFESI